MDNYRDKENDEINAIGSFDLLINKGEQFYKEIDNDFKSQQMEDERKDRLVRNGITIASIVIPTAVTIWGTLKSFKFEETGTVTTTIGRGFINKLIPKK